MNSLSNQLVKRVENAVNYYIGKGATKEIQKAIIYYAKSANKMVMNDIVKNIIKAGGVSLAYTIVSSTDLDEKIKSALVKYVDSYNEAQLLYECFILGKHTARNGVAGISPPRREFQKC